MIAEGFKTIETRTWRTKYRGDILIVKSASPKTYDNGMAIAIAEISDCKSMTKDHEAAACCEVYDRAVYWFLRNIRKIEPLPVKGQLSIYNVDINPEDISFIPR